MLISLLILMKSKNENQIIQIMSIISNYFNCFDFSQKQ